MNGSPTCTVGRFWLASSAANSSEAIVAPWMPSRPVLEPTYTIGLPTPSARAAEDPVGRDDPQVHDVDQDVLVVAVVKRGLAADGRDPDAVAVARDPPHDAVDQVLHARRVDPPEPQRVQGRDRPRAHGEDVAEDAAHSGRGALVRLDEGGVVVRLHLERRRPARRRCRPRRRSRPAPAATRGPVVGNFFRWTREDL